MLKGVKEDIKFINLKEYYDEHKEEIDDEYCNSFDDFFMREVADLNGTSIVNLSKEFKDMINQYLKPSLAPDHSYIGDPKTDSLVFDIYTCMNALEEYFSKIYDLDPVYEISEEMMKKDGYWSETVAYLMKYTKRFSPSIIDCVKKELVDVFGSEILNGTKERLILEVLEKRFDKFEKLMHIITDLVLDYTYVIENGGYTVNYTDILNEEGEN